MEIIPEKLAVYTPELTIGYLDEIEHISIIGKDDDYLKDVNWTFGISKCNNWRLCTSGWWDKIDNLLFVDDHDRKIKAIHEFINNSNKKQFDFNEIFNAINAPQND